MSPSSLSPHPVKSSSSSCDGLDKETHDISKMFFSTTNKSRRKSFWHTKRSSSTCEAQKSQIGALFLCSITKCCVFYFFVLCGVFFSLFSTMKEGLQCFTVLPAVTPGFAHGQQSMWSVPELKTLQINTIRQADAHWWDYSVVAMVNMALLYVTFSWARTKSFRDFKTMLFAT